MTKLYVIYNVETNSFLNESGVTVSLGNATQFQSINDCKIIVDNWKRFNKSIKDWKFQAVEFVESEHINLI